MMRREREGGDCEEVMRWYAQDEVNQEESKQNEVDGMKKGADSTGKVTICGMLVHTVSQ